MNKKDFKRLKKVTKELGIAIAKYDANPNNCDNKIFRLNEFFFNFDNSIDLAKQTYSELRAIITNLNNKRKEGVFLTRKGKSQSYCVSRN